MVGWGVGVGGSVWINLLLHIYTLPVTDKTSQFQDHVNIVYELASFKTMGGSGGGRGGGVVFESISCSYSCSTFTHYQSLTKPVTFKTMFNIVYELASFKTIICGRAEWW